MQPHSGADANLIAYWAILSARVETPALEKLGNDNPSNLSRTDWDGIGKPAEVSGFGHGLLFGRPPYARYRHNVSAQMFDAYTYGVHRETGLLDYDEIDKMAHDIRPLILLAGYSAYPRAIDFSRLRAIADSVGAVLWWTWRISRGSLQAACFTAITIRCRTRMS